MLNETITNYIYVGGSGSGKSVLSVNMAMQLAKSCDKPVHFFDLDQTKPLFRSRDLDRQLTESGVIMHTEEQFYDAPAISIGVERFLKDESLICILDVGGDDRGARMVGQFSRFLNEENTICFYVLNPYRPWSSENGSIFDTLNSVLSASRLQEYQFIINPNLGNETTPAIVIDGFHSVESLLSGKRPIFACCVSKQFADEVAPQIDVPLIEVEHFIKMDWD